MPRRVTVQLECDSPGDSREGVTYYLETPRGRFEVILCPEHAAPLDQVAKWGHVAPQGRTRGSKGGTNEQRLLDILDAND